jgi:hypothetical protein
VAGNPVWLAFSALGVPLAAWWEQRKEPATAIPDALSAPVSGLPLSEVIPSL